jgi:hypothetical protein
MTVAHPKDGQKILVRSKTYFWVAIFSRKQGIGRMIEWKPLTTAQFELLNPMNYTQAEWRKIWENL